MIAEGTLILHIKISCADIRDQLRKGTRGERVFVEYCARRNSTACHDLGEPCRGPPSDTPASVRVTATEEVPPLQAEIRGPTAVIKMSDDNPMYQPNSILIRAGQTVEWLNTGQVSHSVVDDPAKAAKTDDVALPTGVPSFASGNVMPGGKYRHTFLSPGTYKYFCMSHEVDSMVGEIDRATAHPGRGGASGLAVEVAAVALS